MRKKRAGVAVLALFCILSGGAGGAKLAAQAADAPPAALPASYRGLSLGMSLDDLKNALFNDSAFAFRGDPDVSFLPLSTQNLVESEGTGFIKRAFFQLKDGAVFFMAFAMNTTMIDHYSIFTAFVEKYGQPLTLNPREAVWESETVRVSIERPLTVKYIDKSVFDTLVTESRTEKAYGRELRENFLNDF